MDWQTKEHIDSRFDELEEKIDSIMRHFKIEEESFSDDEDDLLDEEEDSKKANI